MGNKDTLDIPVNTRDTLERDLLAEQRTILANERTLLAYIRTALAFFVIGVTFIKFFGNSVMEIIGWTFIPAGLITIGKGIASFRKTKRQVEEDRRARLSP